MKNLHNYNSRSSSEYQVVLPNMRTTVYGIRSIRYQERSTWNFLVKKYKDSELHLKSKGDFRKIIKKHYSNIYN